MSAADPVLLRQAAQLIRKGGLAKGSFYTPTGEHCTVGAMEATLGETHRAEMWEGDPSLKLVRELIGGTGASTFLDVVTWNDHPARTADEVATLLEQAAEKAEANR